MKLTLVKETEIFNSLECPELPRFTILLGVNGSGKTQLLKGIESKEIRVRSPVFHPNGSLKYHSSQSFRLAQNESLRMDEVRLHGENLFGILAIARSKIAVFKDYISTGLPKSVLVGISDEQLIKMEKKLRKDFCDEIEPAGHFVYNHLSRDATFPFLMLSKEEFLSRLPARLQDDRLTQGIANVFGWYLLKVQQNRLKRASSSDVMRKTALEDNEFIEKFGSPPWDELNNLFVETQFPYEVIVPSDVDDSLLEIFFRHKATGSIVAPRNLSNGEQCITNFIFQIMLSKMPFFSETLPNCILLDEADAHLHPALIRIALNALKAILRSNSHTHIILATHSLTTVALCDEDSCHFLSGGKDKKISKITRKEAIKNLSYGIPLLNVDYNLSRQVLVEGNTDADLFTQIYLLIKDEVHKDLNLFFIPSSGGEGNVESVEKTVYALRTNGNSRVYGIIDWDRKRSHSEGLRVIAHESCYCIDNLILNPLSLGILMIRHCEKEITKAFPTIRFSTTPNLAKYQLQEIVDHIEQRILENAVDKTSSLIFLDGLEIQMSQGLLFSSKAELLAKITNGIPFLKRFMQQPRITSLVVEQVYREYKRFIPIAFLNCFRELCESD